MIWIVLAALLSLWTLKFGFAVPGIWLVILMLGVWVAFITSLFVHHERH